MFICGNNFHLKVDINAVDFSLSTRPNLKILEILKKIFLVSSIIILRIIKVGKFSPRCLGTPLQRDTQHERRGVLINRDYVVC